MFTLTTIKEFSVVHNFLIHILREREYNSLTNIVLLKMK